MKEYNCDDLLSCNSTPSSSHYDFCIFITSIYQLIIVFAYYCSIVKALCLYVFFTEIL